ncbi:hypothetical protein [Streptomyces nigra]|uniref:hypothetical protein n=1 Tax=Streptomyces nigra TaxID=1827580 RepID=UPI0034272F74
MTAALIDWPSLSADGFPCPDHIPAFRLVDELAVASVSPDPGVRNDGAYTAAVHWIREGRLDAVLEELGDSAAGRLSHPEVQARTFAPLILWLDVVAEALEGGGPGPVPVWAFNTFATLQSLHLHLTRGIADEGLPPHAEAVATRVAELLRLPYYWLA